MAINKRFKRQWADSPKPTSSPWGNPQTTITYGPGIWEVTTAGHGGIQLSEQRNASVPWYMRSRNGWYEEDQEACIPMIVFPDEFRFKEKPERKEWAENCFRNNFPDFYEKFFKTVLRPGESRKRDEDEFSKTVEDRLQVMTAWGSWANWVPNGMVGVYAGVGGRTKQGGFPENSQYFLIPKEEFDAMQTPIGKVFPLDHQYKAIVPELRHKNPFGQKSAEERVRTDEPLVKTRTVKIEMLLTYDLADNDGGERPDPAKWAWGELLDLSHNERADILSVTDY